MRKKKGMKGSIDGGFEAVREDMQLLPGGLIAQEVYDTATRERE
jgi:hypothetical protein